jgi:hypothetical protein
MTKKEKAQFVVESRRIQTVVAEFDEIMPEDLKSAKVGEAVKECEDTTQNVKATESLVETAKNGEKIAYKKMKEIAKRIRSSVKGAFGDDSLQFERVGGKRASDRKKPSRKQKKDQAA